MEKAYLRAALLLAIALAGTVLTWTFVWRQEGISRKHIFVSSALCLLGLLGLVPAVRDYVSSSRFPVGSLSGTTLALAVLTAGIVLGLTLAGRKFLAGALNDTVARLRIAVDEFRDPELRMRNACTRRYQRALDLLATPIVGEAKKVWRNKLYVALTIRRLTDEEIQVLAEYLNTLVCDGQASTERLAKFLRVERAMALDDLTAASGHLARLVQLSGQLRRQKRIGE